MKKQTKETTDDYLAVALAFVFGVIVYAVLLYLFHGTYPQGFEDGYQNCSSQNATYFNEGFKQGQINTTELVINQLYYAGMQCINITIQSPYREQMFSPDITFVNRECVK